MVLIHGFGADRTAWNGLIPSLSKLRRTIALDLPAHGEAAPWPETPDATVCAKAVIATLQELGAAPVTLVGHSLGGAVASLVALFQPHMVERLILVAPGGFGPEMNVRLLKRYAQARDAETLALVMEQFYGPSIPVPGALPGLMEKQRRHAAFADALPAIAEKISDGDGQGTLPLDKLAAQPFPITLIWGTDDQVLPVQQAHAAPALMARHLLPGVGHMPHLEAPDTVLGIIARTVAGRTED